MICGPLFRSALFAVEIILLPLPVFEPPPPSCIPVTLLTFNSKYLNSYNLTEPPLPLFTVIQTFNLTNKGRLTTVKTQVYKNNQLYSCMFRPSGGAPQDDTWNWFGRIMRGDGVDNNPYDLVLRHSLFKFQALIPEQTVCWVASTLSQLWFPTRHKYKLWHRNHKSRPV
jgi:hypothetical protein